MNYNAYDDKKLPYAKTSGVLNFVAYCTRRKKCGNKNFRKFVNFQRFVIGEFSIPFFEIFEFYFFHFFYQIGFTVFCSFLALVSRTAFG